MDRDNLEAEDRISVRAGDWSIPHDDNRKIAPLSMDAAEILRYRLWNTGLSTSPFQSAAEAVTHLGAVQAQDYTAAKWALGLRVRNSRDAAVEKEFNDGMILRIHVLRPTWHFVPPSDIRWMVALTAPRIKAVLSHYNRKLGLNDALFARTNAAIVHALEGHNFLTRQELKAVLADIGITTDVQRLAHILIWAELDGLICSGPRRGNRFTYALMEERAPRAGMLNRKEGLARLAHTYVTSHGPARIEDFSWWSGFTAKEAGDALESDETVVQTIVKGKTYWQTPRHDIPEPEPPPALLLSLYDEYTIAYRDRSDLSEKRDIEQMISMGNALTSVIVIGGRVAGAWHRSLKNNRVEIRLQPFRKLTNNENEALASEVTRYGEFFGLTTVLAE